MKKILINIILISSLIAPALVHAEEEAVKAEVVKDTDPNVAKLSRLLRPLFGGEKPDEIIKSAVPGMYEIIIGTEVLYVSDDAKYMFIGNIVNRETKENLTAAAKKRAERAFSVKRKEVMAKQDASKTISFKAKDEKQVLNVFTDIDCPYCVKLHNEVPTLNDNGITVNYYLFPRSGPNTPSFSKAISAWCADDKKDALTKAKNRKSIPSKTCENPIVEQYELGKSIGVTGTPALVTEDGTLIPGYMPANILLERLKSK